MYVVGVDGCGGGWISAVYTASTGAMEFAFHWTLREIAAGHEDASCIAVDIPMGLAQGEPRRCDTQARAMLGKRRASVFPVPDRRVLEAFAERDLDYPRTNALSKEITGKGVSAQAYGIFQKVSKADSLLTPALQKRLVEVHPELSFLALSGHPMEFSKGKSGGFEERRNLLAERFPDLPVATRADARRICPPAGPDDVLDAAVAAASALRFAEGEASRLPDSRQIDPRGLRMEINY